MKLNEKKIDMQKVLAPAALVILYVFFSVVGDGFLSMTVFKNILESSYYIGFMAFGVTFIIITGGIDLSLGTVMMCAALLGAYTFKQLHFPLIVSLLVAVLVGAVFGFLNGVMVALAQSCSISRSQAWLMCDSFANSFWVILRCFLSQTMLLPM